MHLQLNLACVQRFVDAINAGEDDANGTAARTASNVLLRAYMDNYIKLEFLPKAFVDFRYATTIICCGCYQPPAATKLL